MDLDEWFKENDADTIAFTCIGIISAISGLAIGGYIGINLFGWKWGIIIGIATASILPVALFYMKEKREDNRKERDYNKYIELRAMNCHKCGDKIIPEYVAEGQWRYDCNKCNRSWKSSWRG